VKTVTVEMEKRNGKNSPCLTFNIKAISENCEAESETGRVRIQVESGQGSSTGRIDRKKKEKNDLKFRFLAFFCSKFLIFLVNSRF